MTPEQLTLASVNADGLSFKGLSNAIDDLREAGRPTKTLEGSLWHKLSAPMSAVLMPLSTGRWPTWLEMFPGVTEDTLSLYGPAVALRLEGMHIDVLNRCLANRDAAFTEALERFEAARALQHDAIAALCGVGAAARALGRGDEAEAAWAEAARRSPWRRIKSDTKSDAKSGARDAAVQT